MLVVVAGHVAQTRFLGEETELLSLAIVQDVDVELVRRPIDIDGGQRGVAHQAQGLVVRGDQ